MEVLVTSVTKLGETSCIGGICLNDQRMIRLMNPGNEYEPQNSDLIIGSIWEIEFENGQQIIPPHVEDVVISSKKYVRAENDIKTYILNCGVEIFRGPPHNIFEGLLHWTGNGNGYFPENSRLPQRSVGFWISDKDLIFNGKHYYYFTDRLDFPYKRIPFVGYVDPIDVIPAGTLMRISTARWWKPKDKEMELRCYLQLSGWYI